MRENPSKNQLSVICDKKGVTLIELLVVLVISGIVIGGVYRVFISQTKAYSVQEQVAEIQQDVRGAMEIMVRDVRMSGSKHRNFDSPAIINNPILTPLSDTSITVNYEYNAALNTVTYAFAGGVLTRTLNAGTAETLLNNVASLNFSYGIDADKNGEIDGVDEATGLAPNSAFKKAADVGAAKVLAVRIELIANPEPDNPDVAKVVSPRTLTSVVTSRNLYNRRYLEY